MDLETFIRRPFMVEAIEITEENLTEIAELIGTVRRRGSSSYIAVDRRVVPNIPRAYVGWWLTVVGENYRVYSPKLFRTLFVKHHDVMAFTFDAGKLNEDDRAAMLKEALKHVLEEDILDTIIHVDSDPLPPHGIERP